MKGGARFLLLSLLLVGASVCLALGLTMPILRLTRFYIWTDVHSLISIVGELYLRDEVFLAVVIMLFSIVFPILKLLYLCVLHFGAYVYDGSRRPWLKRAAILGKWSMLDVLLLALLIFYVKTSALTDAVSMSGIYMFAASVVLTMVAHAFIEHEVERVDNTHTFPPPHHDALDNSDNKSQT
ncbi:MAG: paraquat-inducible protein A [Alphaproteobacteria bacterium]